MGVIVLLGLIALIVWDLNNIITKDFATTETPAVTTQSNNTSAISTTTVTQNVLPTPTSTSTATSSPIKTTTPTKTTVAPVVQPTTPASSTLIVTFTDKGFSPTSLTIKKGQTVTFVNNSSGKMWVAANPFPTSSEYPAFNEKSGVSNGSSWSFTFDKTGVWFYHNHYSPAQGAKIVVNAN